LFIVVILLSECRHSANQLYNRNFVLVILNQEGAVIPDDLRKLLVNLQ
jgi:hypothetical protein